MKLKRAGLFSRFAHAGVKKYTSILMNRERYFRPVPLLSVVVLIAAFAVSCSSNGNSNISFRLSKENIIDKVENLTRTGKIYRDLDTILVADIFWNSSELTKELVEELKRTDRVDGKEYNLRMESVEKSDKKFVEFIAACYTSEMSWNDFHEKKSIWSIRLVGKDGELIEPFDIDKLLMKDIRDKHFFPFITQWRTIYRIQFVRDENLTGVEEYDLKVFSTMGEAEFKWATTEAEMAKSAYTKELILDVEADKKEDGMQEVSNGNGHSLDTKERSRIKKGRIRKGLF